MEIIKVRDKNEFAGTEFYMYIPFLTDCASNYYAYAVDKIVECIVLIMDGNVEVVHISVEDFLDTIVAFYDENVYYLDEDGYLSYDYEKEGIVGHKHNPEVEYWSI